MKKGTRGQSFLYGALLLTRGMAAVKVLGALFKIPLQGIIGAYGMGLFHTAYHYLGPVFTLATAGFPVAVSRLVSEQAALGRWEQVRRVRKTAMPLFLALGAGGVGLLGLAAPWYCRKVLGDPLAGAPVAALAPAVLLGTVGAVYRGYWEGLRNMAPTALSQILEAVVRLGAGLLGAWAAMAWGRWEWAARGTVLGGDPGPEGLPLALAALGAAGAMAGVTAGCGASALYLWAKSRRGDGLPLGAGRDTPSGPVGRKLLSILLPVGAGSLAGNAAGLLEASLLPRRLAAAWEASPQAILSLCGGSLPQEALSQPQALPTFLYGCCAMALTLSLLVPAVAQAFGASALPAVTQAWARGRGEELRHRMGAVLHGAALFSFPLGLGLAALGEPLAQALYGEGPGGRLAGAALTVLGAASLPTALCGPLSSMLQGVGRADLPPGACWTEARTTPWAGRPACSRGWAGRTCPPSSWLWPWGSSWGRSGFCAPCPRCTCWGWVWPPFSPTGCWRRPCWGLSAGRPGPGWLCGPCWGSPSYAPCSAPGPPGGVFGGSAGWSPGRAWEKPCPWGLPWGREGVFMC